MQPRVDGAPNFCYGVGMDKTWLVSLAYNDDMDVVIATSFQISENGDLLFIGGATTRQGITVTIPVHAYAAGAWLEVWEDVVN